MYIPHCHLLDGIVKEFDKSFAGVQDLKVDIVLSEVVPWMKVNSILALPCQA